MQHVTKRIANGVITTVLTATGLFASQHVLATISVVPTKQSEGARNSSRGGLISRSDIVLGRPNLEATQALTLGNGRLGVAVWSADGLTAQLNRGDTLPELLPVARISIPGLSALTRANNYSGRLALYDAEFREQGCGQTISAFVDKPTDTFVIDVTGADPAQVQTRASSSSGRRHVAPSAEARGARRRRPHQ